MAEKLSTALANQLADNLFDSFNGGTLEIRTGSQPSTGDTSATGSLLVSVALPNPAFTAASNGSKSKTGTWSGTGIAAGNAGWCRFKSSDNSLNLDGTVTGIGGGGELELDNVNIAVSQIVTINSGDAAQPKE